LDGHATHYHERIILHTHPAGIITRGPSFQSIAFASLYIEKPPPSSCKAKQTKKKPTSREEAGKERHQQQARGEEVAPAAAMATDLGFEETELRLGLPGGGGGGGQLGGEGRSSSSGKRGFAETIDLKLKLEPATPAAVVKAEGEEQDDGAALAAAKEGVAAAAEEAGGKMKRSPSQSSVVTAAAVQADPAEKPRAPKYVAEDLSFPPCLSLSSFVRPRLV
jgi:auxin-responsive protein IAA